MFDLPEIAHDPIAMEVAFQVAAVADWAQTRAIAVESERTNHTGRFEANPLLGRYPSRRAINNYFIASMIGHAAISYALPTKYRVWWQASTLAIEVAVVGRNAYLGIGMKF